MVLKTLISAAQSIWMCYCQVMIFADENKTRPKIVNNRDSYGFEMVFKQIKLINLIAI